MVQLDAGLMLAARRILDGGSHPQLEDRIFAYERAVNLHNSGWGNYKYYQRGAEIELHAYLIKHRLGELTRQRIVVLEQVKAAMAESRALEVKCGELDNRVDAGDLGI
jgi:hypothetical protein